MIIDQYGRKALSDSDLCCLLYKDPEAEICNIPVEDPGLHNQAIKDNFSDLCELARLPEITVSPAEWHRHNQSLWHMPGEYAEMDIARWILDRCNNETELQRCGMELLEYQERDLMPLLRYLKYLVDTMAANNIVWGVGRGSSVASFVLYKLGVHRIDSIYYDLDFHEFMR